MGSLLWLIWITENISFYSWKKQQPVSIAFSASSSFLSLSLFARLVPMDSVLKSSILIVQKLALHQNGVEFRQQVNGSIRTSLTAPHDDIRRRARLKTLIFFFFNPSPSSCGAVLKERQIWKLSRGQPRGQLSVHVHCIYWLTVQLLRDQRSSSVHFLYSTEVTNQKPGNLLHRQGTHTPTQGPTLTAYIAR